MWPLEQILGVTVFLSVLLFVNFCRRQIIGYVNLVALRDFLPFVNNGDHPGIWDMRITLKAEDSRATIFRAFSLKHA